MLSTWYGFFDNWQLYGKVTIDGVNRTITVNDGVTELDIKTDVYSFWKQWLLIDSNIRYLEAMRTIGGDPTTAGERFGDGYFMKNNWKLVIDLTATAVTGVLFSDDFETAYYDAAGNPQFPATVSNLVTTIETEVAGGGTGGTGTDEGRTHGNIQVT